MQEPTSVLVVAHQTAATPDLLDAVRDRAAQGNTRFHLVVPRQPHGLNKVANPADHGRDEAEAVLHDALPKLSAAAGSEVTGVIGDSVPLTAIHDAANRDHFDELIISTLPLGASKWLKLDLISKARGLGLPVTHVAADVSSKTLVAH
jgi:hypothetical protein